MGRECHLSKGPDGVTVIAVLAGLSAMTLLLGPLFMIGMPPIVLIGRASWKGGQRGNCPIGWTTWRDPCSRQDRSEF